MHHEQITKCISGVLKHIENIQPNQVTFKGNTKIIFITNLAGMIEAKLTDDLKIRIRQSTEERLIQDNDTFEKIQAYEAKIAKMRHQIHHLASQVKQQVQEII
jgi:hypothetical protein